MIFKLIIIFGLLFTLQACQQETKRNYLGIKMKPLYERDLNEWALKHSNTNLNPPSWYPVKINIERRWFKARMRIRGDLARHWSQPVKSFRIELLAGTWKGMTELDLIIPEDKGYELEAVAYEWAALLKIPVTYYEYVDVQINHKKLGTYLLLERSGQAGELIGENNAWLNSIDPTYKSIYKNVSVERDSFNPLSLEPSIYKASNKSTSAQLAMTHFSYMLEEMKVAVQSNSPVNWEKYLDREAAAKWAALVILLGSIHPTFGDNLRWAYAKESKTFSPLLYDVLAYSRQLKESECLYGPFTRSNVWFLLWMKDPFMKSRIIYWVNWLHDQPAINLDKTWSSIVTKYGLNEWDARQEKERILLKERIQKNLASLGPYLKKDLCL